MGFYSDRTQSLVQYYREKYGEEALKKLEEEAGFCEEKNDLQRRNRLLRVRDELLLEDLSIR